MAIAAAVAIIGCSKSNDDGTWLPDGSPKVNAEVVVDETLDLVNDGFIIKDERFLPRLRSAPYMAHTHSRGWSVQVRQTACLTSRRNRPSKDVS